MPSGRSYMDHNATAPLRREARAAMYAALELTGNPASAHAEGRRAREIVERARDEVAALVGAKPEEVVFTSGATEANNWVLRAGWQTIVTAAHEHDSVLAVARAAGADLVELPCDLNGIVDLAFLCRSGASADAVLPGKGRLLSLQLANSETGVLQPIIAAIEAARSHGLVTHTDAVQAVGRTLVDFAGLGVDLMSISSHKLGGPQGIGALVIRDGIELPAFILGGGQQRRRRSGTENVAGIAGFGAAAKAAREGLGEMVRIKALRDRLEAGVREITPDAVIVGSQSPRLPNTSCIAVPGAQAATLLIWLDLAGLAVSAGSACSSGKIGSSHVLAAMGLDERLARSAIRVSLGEMNTDGDVDRFLDVWSHVHRGNVARSTTTESSLGWTAAAPVARAITA